MTQEEEVVRLMERIIVRFQIIADDADVLGSWGVRELAEEYADKTENELNEFRRKFCLVSDQ